MSNVLGLTFGLIEVLCDFSKYLLTIAMIGSIIGLLLVLIFIGFLWKISSSPSNLSFINKLVNENVLKISFEKHEGISYNNLNKVFNKNCLYSEITNDDDDNADTHPGSVVFVKMTNKGDYPIRIMNTDFDCNSVCCNDCELIRCSNTSVIDAGKTEHMYICYICCVDGAEKLLEEPFFYIPDSYYNYLKMVWNFMYE